DGGRVEVEPVALGERAERGQVRWSTGVEDLAKLFEVGFEAGRRDDLQQTRGLVGGIPEGVGDAAGLDHHAARSGLEDLLANLHADRPFEDERILVLMPMRMHGGAKRPGCKWV